MKAPLRFVLPFFAFLACTFSSWAVGNESPFAFDAGLRLLGADVGVGYRGLALIPEADTTIWAYAGGGYEWLSYYREPSGALVAPGALGGRDPSFVRIEGAWRLGVEQGFAWNERTKRNLVEAFAFYRGRYDLNESQPGQLLYDATIPDQAGILLHTAQVGFAYDDLLFETKHKTRSGMAAELSAEWGPGSLDYLRFNWTFRWFLPLYDVAPDRPVNLLSMYLGELYSVDYAMGLSSSVPLFIRQTFGGRNQATGLGGAMRGVDSGSLDTNLKAVNNLEVRANLPALFLPDLVPGIVVFWDLGYYNQMGETGIAVPGSGFVRSTGAGVYLDLLDIATVAAYVDYRLDAVNAGGSPWTLGAIEFGLHF